MDTYHIATLFVLFLIFFIILIGYFTYKYSKKEKHKEKYKGEYSPITLVMPFKPGMSFKDILFGFLLSIYFWAIGVIIVFLYAIIIFTDLPNTTEVILDFIVGGTIALFFSFLYVSIMWYVDKKEREPFRFVPTLFFIGTITAFLATILNNLAEGSFRGVVDQTNSGLLIIIIIAPLIEEILKGLGVYLMSFHHEMDDMMDGILYGFVIGTGFSFIENWGYYSVFSPYEIGLFGWFNLVILRTLGGGFFHGVFTALTGATLGLSKTKKTKFFLPAIFLPAIAAHIIFNLITVLDKFFNISSNEICGVLLIFVILLFFIFISLVTKALKSEKGKVKSDFSKSIPVLKSSEQSSLALQHS